MAVPIYYEQYAHGVTREDVQPYDKGLELLWQTAVGQPALWHAIRVRGSDLGDPEGSIRVWFEDEDEILHQEPADFLPLTSFRTCTNAFNNLKKVAESKAAWPPSWGKDVSEFALKYTSDKQLTPCGGHCPSDAAVVGSRRNGGLRLQHAVGGKYRVMMFSVYLTHDGRRHMRDSGPRSLQLSFVRSNFVGLSN